MNKDSSLAETFSLLPCSAKGPVTLDCRHLRSVLSHCTPSHGDWLNFVSSKMNVSPNLLWHLSELQLQIPALWWFIEWELQRNLLHHRANLFRFSRVHNIPLTWPTRVYKLCLLREICLLVFPSIHHLNVTFTVSPPLSFHPAVCMNNICHVALPSLKVTLVNYWSGQMITGLTSVCSRLPLSSVFMSTLFLLVFLETLLWWITVCCYCWGSVGTFTETWNLKLQM